MRKFDRHIARKLGRLKAGKGRRHTYVAMREVRALSYEPRPGYTAGGYSEVLTTHREYLHATKGWKKERHSLKRTVKHLDRDGRSFFWYGFRRPPPPIEGETYKTLPNPKYVRAA